MPLFSKKKKGEATTSPNDTTKLKKGGDRRTVKIPFCKCNEDDIDPVEDDCDNTRGCGKPLHFCGECYKLIKQKGVDQCSCAFTERRLKNTKRGDYGEI